MIQCKSFGRYKGVLAPTCFGGKGCQACWTKYYSHLKGTTMISRKTGAQRLLKLAAFLETVPRENFNMGYWTSDNRGPTTKCGSSGCALGWACTMPSFRRLGLKIDGGKPVISFHGPAKLYGFAAAEDLFGLTNGEANFLFGVVGPWFLTSTKGVKVSKPESWTATPKKVAKQIRQFVKYFRS